MKNHILLLMVFSLLTSLVFTFIAKTMDEIEESLEIIRQETGVVEIRNLPALRTFKIKVDFAL